MLDTVYILVDKNNDANNKIREALQAALTITKIEAMDAGIPIHVMKQREIVEDSFYIIHKNLYDIIVDIEVNVISKTLNDPVQLLRFNSALPHIILQQLTYGKYKNRLQSLILSATESINIEEFDKQEFASDLADRFFQFWCNVCIKDTIKCKLTKLINANLHHQYGNYGMRNALAHIKGAYKSKSNQKDNDNENWVLCELCTKWRLLPNTFDMNTLNSTSLWFCELSNEHTTIFECGI